MKTTSTMFQCRSIPVWWSMTVAILLGVAGCNTASKQRLSANVSYDNGAPNEAIARLNEMSSGRGAEEQIVAVDTALAKLMSGDTRACELLLRESRSEIEFLQQKDLAEQASAVLRDDRSVAWTGREYERRMVDNVLILASLLGDHQDAFAYASQAMNRVADDQRILQPDRKMDSIVTVGHTALETPVLEATSTPPLRMSPNAFSAYLHAAVHSENPMNQDLTDRSIRQVSYWQHDSEDASSLSTLGTNTKKGHGALHVITFVGRITDWTAERVAPTSASLLIADQILSAVGDHTLPPTVAAVKIARPTLELSSNRQTTVAHVPGQIDNAVAGETLLDLNRTALDSYANDRDDQIARAVVRRIVKKGAVYATKDQLSVEKDTPVDLLMNVGGVAWEALEKPDTRHLSFLPERVEVLQLELPVGRHTVHLNSIASGTRRDSGTPAELTVSTNIDDGRNTFVLCYRTASGLTQFVGGNQVIPSLH